MKFKCGSCSMVFNGIIPYQSHINSMKHVKVNLQSLKLKYGKLTQTVMSDPYIKEYQNEYKCVICNVTLNSFQQAEAHANGKKHKSLLQNKVLVIPMECVSSYKPTASEESLKSPFTFHNITVENAMSDIKIFNCDDPVCF